MRSRSVIDMHIVNRMQAFGWPPIIAAIGLVVVLAEAVPDPEVRQAVALCPSGALHLLDG